LQGGPLLGEERISIGDGLGVKAPGGACSTRTYGARSTLARAEIPVTERAREDSNL
jgi:hypothetical protein